MTQQLHNKALMATVKEVISRPQSSRSAEKKDEARRSHSHSSSSDGGSSVSSEQCLLSPKSVDGEARETRGPRRLNLDLTLDSYPSTDSLHVLGELLCDIRRSCTTSLTSTPVLSSDGEITGADTVFESKLRRSATELRAMSESGSITSDITLYCGLCMLYIL